MLRSPGDSFGVREAILEVREAILELGRPFGSSVRSFGSSGRSFPGFRSDCGTTEREIHEKPFFRRVPPTGPTLSKNGQNGAQNH